ncbi:hypothetical protein QTP88_007310 [Uroleucon formosanum]
MYFRTIVSFSFSVQRIIPTFHNVIVPVDTLKKLLLKTIFQKFLIGYRKQCRPDQWPLKGLAVWVPGGGALLPTSSNI